MRKLGLMLLALLLLSATAQAWKKGNAAGGGPFLIDNMGNFLLDTGGNKLLPS